ncbi:MAG TPA: PH domain-containing protein [Thermoplasmata archaeon]|nr:PH domain-containing protein [Thermoplasmata archaeon]
MAETTLLSLRPTRLVYLSRYLTWIVTWVVGAIVILGPWRLLPDAWQVPGLNIRVQTLLGYIIAFVGLLALLSAEIKRIATRFVVTTDRVTRSDGVFRRKTIQMPFSKVERIELDQGILQRMLRIGDIVVDTGEDTVVLESLRHVRLVHDELTKHLAAAGRRI